MSATTIRNIARRVRRWAVREAHASHFPSDLMGFCAIGARKLFLELQAAGLKPKLALAGTEDESSHCFVVVDDYVVDVTATQFYQAKVVVRHLSRIKCRPWFWTPLSLYSTMRGFDARLAKDGWPDEQFSLKARKQAQL